MFKFLLLLVCCFSVVSAQANSEYRQAVVLQYHHVSDKTPAITSVTPEQLREHLALIKAEGFQVLPLPEVIDTLRNKGSFKQPTAVITFDDAYDSIYHAAFPLLQQYEFPFTIFVAPKPVEKDFGGTLTWQQIKEMQSQGVTIANHSYAHDHLVKRLDNESEQDWLARIKADTQQAQASLEAELGDIPKYMAYPFGEFDEKLKDLMKEMGYIAFGQQSGPIHSTSDFYALPRFPASGNYANLDTLKTKLNSHAFHLLKQLPEADVLTAGDAVPELTLTVKDNGFRHKQVQCFYAGSPVETKTKKDETDTVFIQAKALEKLEKGRSRYNCTAPSEDGSAYFWHSMAFIAQ